MLIDLARLGTVIDAPGGRRWSRSRMRAEVERRTAALAGLGVRSGDTALVLHANSLEFLADLLALWQLGACAACLEPGASARELDGIVDRLRPRLALVSGNTPVAAVGVTTECLGGADGNPVVTAQPPPAPRWETVSQQPALVLFTSGTTAHPRGVVHTYHGLRARLTLNLTHIGAADLRRSLCVLPTHFGHGLIGNCLTPLHAGADLVLAAGAGLCVGARLGAILDEHDITFLSSVPALWRVVLKLSDPPRSGSLSRVHVGSAPLGAALWRDVQSWAGTRRVINAYGLTEAANWIAGASGEEHAPADGLVGRFWGGRGAVLADDGRVHDSGTGELIIKVPSLMQGYFGEPELTAAAMHHGWYRTGDLAEIAGDGTVRLGARRGLAINRAGITLHPESIEAVLDEHPAVHAACAFGVPDAFAGEIVGCAVALEPGADAAQADLARWCAQRMRPDAVPQRWWVLSELPRDPRGKLRRREIARRCLRQDDNA